MSAPPVYGQQPPQYGPPQGQPLQYGPPANGGQPSPQYAGPTQYGPPQGQPGQPPAQQTGVGSPSQQSDDASSFFDGASGSPSISFPRGEYQVWKGGIFTGVITKKQARNFDTKKPEFWDSGDPVMDVVFEVLTQDRDGNNPLDDGRRRMFVTQRDTNIPDSLASVVKEATRSGFHRGGQIWICKVGQRKGDKSDRNVWQASYTPPTAETLRILDSLPPQGVSQAAANEVAAQASYSEPNGGNPYQAPPAQQGPPQQYQQSPAPQQYGPPQGYAQQGPPQQQYGPSQGQPPAQGYAQQGPPPQQYGPPNGGQPQHEQGNPWAGQQGAPQQTQNPYYQQ